MFTSVHKVFTKCSQSVHKVFTRCSPGVRNCAQVVVIKGWSLGWSYTLFIEAETNEVNLDPLWPELFPHWPARQGSAITVSHKPPLPHSRVRGACADLAGTGPSVVSSKGFEPGPSVVSSKGIVNFGLILIIPPTPKSYAFSVVRLVWSPLNGYGEGGSPSYLGFLSGCFASVSPFGCHW